MSFGYTEVTPQLLAPDMRSSAKNCKKGIKKEYKMNRTWNSLDLLGMLYTEAPPKQK